MARESSIVVTPKKLASSAEMPPADPDFEPSVRQMIEHVNLVYEPHGVVVRQRVDEHAEPDAPSALRRRGQEQVGRRRQRERARVVLA